jgi:catechol 2,3-dioxygenase-like lactoylglutathione lyase family enzyme
VQDAVAARAFYEGALGLTVVEDTPFALVLEAKGAMLRVTPVAELVVQPFTIAGWAVPDIEVTVAALRERGVEFARYEGL